MTNQPLPTAYAFTNNGVFDSNDGVHFVTGVSGNTVTTLFANQLGTATIVSSNSIFIGNSTYFVNIQPPNPAQILANYLLSANGTWIAGSGGGGGGVGGANLSVQYNFEGVGFGDNNFTWNPNTLVMTVGNSTVNVTINTTAFSGTTLLANSAAFVGSVSAANVVSNAQLIANLANYAPLASPSFTGNVSVDTSATYAAVNILASTPVYTNNESGNNGLEIATGYTAGSDYTIYMGADKTNGVGYIQAVRWGTAVAPLYLNGRGGIVQLGNLNSSVFAGTVVLGNSTVNASINSTVFSSGNSTVNTVANTTTDTYSNSTQTSSYGLDHMNVGANVTVNSSTVFVGNSTVNASMNSTSFALNGGQIAANWVVRSSNYTALNGDKVLADTSAGPFTVTLPASPANGMFVSFADAANTWSGNNLTINPNGANVAGVSANLTCDVSSYFGLLYDKTGWQVAVTNPPASSPSGAIVYNVAQTLSNTSTAQARQNIGLKGVTARVHLASNVSVTVSTITKVAFDTVDFDPTSCWDSTNKWFKPQQSGTYQVTVSISGLGTASSASILVQGFISKNGSVSTATNSQAEGFAYSPNGTGVIGAMANFSCLVQLNGSTDTVEADVIISGGTSCAIQSIPPPNVRTFMTICRVGD